MNLEDLNLLELANFESQKKVGRTSLWYDIKYDSDISFGSSRILEKRGVTISASRFS